MEIYIVKDYEEMSKNAALIIARQINEKPNSVLGLATGSTPIGIYKELVDMYKKGEVDFSKVITFNLDEYCNLPKENESSYYSFMMDNLINHINIKKENIFIPNGMAKDIKQECKDYEKKIKEVGGIDLQLLGIGGNAHIGFNEPSENLNIDTNIVNLTEDTIRDNSRFFDEKEDVPRTAISMGIGTIMRAKKIIMVANGEGKAQAIKSMTSGYINTQAPSSVLQAHSNFKVIIDQAAAKLIV